MSAIHLKSTDWLSGNRSFSLNLEKKCFSLNLEKKTFTKNWTFILAKMLLKNSFSKWSFYQPILRVIFMCLAHHITADLYLGWYWSFINIFRSFNWARLDWCFLNTRIHMQTNIGTCSISIIAPPCTLLLRVFPIIDPLPHLSGQITYSPPPFMVNIPWIFSVCLKVL